MQMRPTLGLLIVVVLLAVPAHAGTRVVTLLDNATLADGVLQIPSVPTLQARRVTLFGRATTGGNVRVQCGFSLDATTDPLAVESVTGVIVAQFNGTSGAVEPKSLAYEGGQPPTDVAGPNLVCSLSCTGVGGPPLPYIPCSGTVTLKALLGR